MSRFLGAYRDGVICLAFAAACLLTGALAGGALAFVCSMLIADLRAPLWMVAGAITVGPYFLGKALSALPLAR